MSQNNNLFGYDEIFEDNKSKADFAALIGVIIRLILAVTTGGFFFMYVGDLFTWLAGSLYSPYLSAATGVFCIDGLAYFWSKLRQRSGNTETQLTAATIGTIGNMLLSVLVTVVFIILMTDFVALYDAGGQLNDIGQAVNIAGLLIATIAIGGNGVLWAYSDANSSAVRQALSAAKLAAARFAGQFAIEDQQNRLIIGRTIEELRAALPQYTNNAAARNRAQYLLEHFKDLDADGDGRLSDQELAAVPRSLNRSLSPSKGQPEQLIVYRQLPNYGRKPFGVPQTDYLIARDIIFDDSHKTPPGTNYWITSNGKTVNQFQVTDLTGDYHLQEVTQQAQ